MMNCLFGIILLLCSSWTLASKESISSCLRAVGSMSSELAAQWLFPGAAPDRNAWTFLPLRDPRNPTRGIRIGQLTSEARTAVESILKEALGPYGFATVENIRALDEILKFRPEKIDPRYTPNDYGDKEYSVAIFGEPGADSWMLRLQGHHLSINITFEGERIVAATPLSLGEYPEVVHLRHPDEAARALALLLLERKAEGVQPEGTLPRRIHLYPGKDVRAIQPAGISYAEFSSKESALFNEIVRTYTENLANPLRSQLAERVRLAEIQSPQKVFFSWMGSMEVGLDPHHFYLQIQPGEGMTIELQNLGDDHIHSVLRDFQNDFGGMTH